MIHLCYRLSMIIYLFCIKIFELQYFFVKYNTCIIFLSKNIMIFFLHVSTIHNYKNFIIFTLLFSPCIQLNFRWGEKLFAIRCRDIFYILSEILKLFAATLINAVYHFFRFFFIPPEERIASTERCFIIVRCIKKPILVI